MVVPIKDDVHNNNKMEKKELVGNRKEFRIGKNSSRLRIIGNGNKIVVQVNEGVLDVIGNMIRVKVLINKGKINFIGNNSKIYIGKDSPNTKVQCSGNDIKFKLVPIEQIMKRNTKSSEISVNVKLENEMQNTESRDYAETPYIQIKNNISLPNLDIVSNLDISNGLRLSTSTSNIIIGNLCRIQK